MSDPAQIDIIADRRVDYSDELAFLGVDYTGSTFAMQVRATKDTAGTPLLDLSSGTGNFSIFYAATDTIANHILAGALTSDIYAVKNPATGQPYVAGDSETVTIVHFGIGFAALATLPWGDERGDDWQGWFDIIRDPPSGSNEIIVRGEFIVRAGVTIP